LESKFCWRCKFVSIHEQVSADHSQKLITILTTTGSIGGVLVWASQCLAYIRYHNWCRVHKSTIKSLMRSNDRYARYYRWDNNNKKHYLSVWGPTQPVPALLGLISCFLIVFVFSTATWWDHSATAKKVAVAFAGIGRGEIHLYENLLTTL
jgi:amino acid transporter